MSLSYKQIWERYSQCEFKRRLYIKRLNTDGTYESDYSEISQGLMKDGSVKSISRTLPNDSYQFGYVTVNNVSLEILSAYQEFASELDPNSIFSGFIRHKSIVKVVDAFIDKYSGSELVEQTTNGVFETWAAGPSAPPTGWVLGGGGGQAAVREATIKTDGSYSVKLTRTTSPNAYIWQNIHTAKGIAYWKGKTITFSCWIYGGADGSSLIQIGDGVGQTTAWHTGGTGWQKISCTRTISTSATYVQLLCVTTTTGAAYFDNASVLYASGAGINPVEAEVTTFVGLIDATTAQTEQGYEKITVLDFISVLDNINVSELSLTKTTMNELIYEILNRSEFTQYFSVSNSTDYINAGYNATGIDVTKYKDSTVLEMVQDLAKGHSIFYIDPEDNYFYFKPADPTATVVHEFLEANNRKLDISKWREGIDRQVTNWYWENIDEFLSDVEDDWTSAGWSGSTNNWSHTTGNTSILSEPSAPESGKPYKITYTVEDRTAGTFTIAFGGTSNAGLSASGVLEVTTSTTGNLQITPTSDFNGSIKISIVPVIKAVNDEAQVIQVSETCDIKGITNNTQRQNLINYLLTRSKDAKPYFSLSLPYFPVIKLLDRVKVQSFGSAPRDAVRWGMFKWTDKDTGDPNTAPRWRKPAGIRISSDDEWMVRGISHDANFRTIVELQKIL